jgi:hypothetical protein
VRWGIFRGDEATIAPRLAARADLTCPSLLASQFAASKNRVMRWGKNTLIDHRPGGDDL